MATTVGKNILDNLTTGMYSDSKVIYREYIQNACDQIDLATQIGLLAPNEGSVDIFTDSHKRYISIKDNATGVRSEMFIEDVGDIANSNKQIGKNKGFRGIGRLCGLAYCKTLKFTTSYAGESVKSIMTCDAQKMRAMLVENKKYTLDEIWDAIVTYSTEDEASDKHYFEVAGEKRFDRERIASFCTERGIALYDTATEVRRLAGNASDKFLEVVTPTDLHAMLRTLPHCRAIVTTGEKATDTLVEQLGCEKPRVGEYTEVVFEERTIRIYRMPSSSRAYPLKLERKAEAYAQMLCEEGIL